MSIKNEDILNAISQMNVLELIELTKAIEEKFNISASSFAPVTQDKNDDAEEKVKPEEKTTYSVVMTSFGDSKLNVIKTIRTMLDLGLKEAKEFVEKTPAIIKENIQKDDADKIKLTLEACGAMVEIK